MNKFKIHSKFKPMGDQPKAIDSLTGGIEEGREFQTLLGVTGSGKTYTMANIIERVQKPTIVLAHNKTLAAQLCSEFKEFFPNNIVEYFVSYYDYYQPENSCPDAENSCPTHFQNLTFLLGHECRPQILFVRLVLSNVISFIFLD